MTQKFINAFAAAALLFTASALVVMSARQAGAQPQEACLQYVGCSH
jgi:uncharacterized membrane protein YqgA involved in biofilm formation